MNKLGHTQYNLAAKLGKCFMGPDTVILVDIRVKLQFSRNIPLALRPKPGVVVAAR